MRNQLHTRQERTNLLEQPTDIFSANPFLHTVNLLGLNPKPRRPRSPPWLYVAVVSRSRNDYYLPMSAMNRDRSARLTLTTSKLTSVSHSPNPSVPPLTEKRLQARRPQYLPPRRPELFMNSSRISGLGFIALSPEVDTFLSRSITLKVLRPSQFEIELRVIQPVSRHRARRSSRCSCETP
jgi:hypothetical protein